MKNGVPTGLTEDIFRFVNKPYDLYCLEKKRTVLNGTKSPSSLALKIWELVPQSIKDKSELNSKLKSKHKLPANAHAGSENIYVGCIGFI